MPPLPDGGLMQRIVELEAKVAVLVTPKSSTEAAKPHIVLRLAPAGSTLIALVTLFVSAWYYNHVLNATQRSLANNLIYTMQKDERALSADYASGKPGVTPANIIGQLQSVFVQRRLKSIPDDYWPMFVSDFCDVMSKEVFRRTWADLRDQKNGAFSKDFVPFMNDIADPKSATCKYGR